MKGKIILDSFLYAMGFLTFNPEHFLVGLVSAVGYKVVHERCHNQAFEILQNGEVSESDVVGNHDQEERERENEA